MHTLQRYRKLHVPFESHLLAFASLAVENTKSFTNSCFMEKKNGLEELLDSKIQGWFCFLYVYLRRIRLDKQCLVSVNSIIVKHESGSGCSVFQCGVAAFRFREAFSSQTGSTMWKRGDAGFAF